MLITETEYQSPIDIKQEFQYSSRMRTVRCNGRRGGCTQGGVCPGGLPRGVSAKGVSATLPLAQCMLGYTPSVDRIIDTHL